jgi:hypothetical protein
MEDIVTWQSNASASHMRSTGFMVSSRHSITSVKPPIISCCLTSAIPGGIQCIKGNQKLVRVIAHVCHQHQGEAQLNASRGVYPNAAFLIPTYANRGVDPNAEISASSLCLSLCHSF